MSSTHRSGRGLRGTPTATRSLHIAPLARVIDATLDLAWMEAAGRTLDPDELRVLDLGDELWHVRADITRRMDDDWPPDNR